MRRAQWGAVVAAMAIGAFVALPAAPGGAQVATPNSITIKKVVVGTAPEGTVFKVEVECDEAPGGTVYFDENGTPSDKNGDSDPGSNVIDAAATDSCTVTETVDGGATVSYSCDDEDSTRTTCSDNEQAVDFNDVTGSDATVTITNTFEETPTTTTTTVAPTTTTVPAAPVTPATPVKAAARFTG